MPLLRTLHPADHATFGLWQIAEPEPFFQKDIPLTEAESAELALFKGVRRLEWLAGRWLLHKLTGAEQRLLLGKDTFAKPFFLNHPEQHCSLSHSHGIVGALLSDCVCGCDVQVMVDKMPRLAAKFVNLKEAEFIGQFGASEQFDLFHVFWTAKESLYKAYGLKELDFRGHIRLDPFDWNGRRGRCTGWVEKDRFSRGYELIFAKHTLEDQTEFIWTVCLEMPVI